MNPKIKYRIRNLKKYSFKNSYFDGFEIGSEEILPNILKILKLKKELKGKNISLHSQLGRIFSCNDKKTPEFLEAEMNFLKYEIKISKLIGIKQINFHMKETPLTSKEISQFKKIIKYAKKNKVELIYENHVCSAKTILDILNTFPEINFCLDFGHLNLAIKKNKFCMPLDHFIKKIKKRIINIHSHNNYGENDEHNSLDKGTFQWKETLQKLTNSTLKNIIIESKENEKEILRNKKILEEFYK